MGASAESNMWGALICEKLRTDSDTMSSKEGFEVKGYLITQRKLVKKIMGEPKIEF
jgi:hypothetical protein